MKKETTVTDHLGNKFSSISAMCKYYQISRSTYNHRVERGWTLEAALTTPSRRGSSKANPMEVKERMSAYNKSYRRKNLSKEKRRRKTYYETHKEAEIQKSKDYYYAHRDEVRAYQQRYRKNKKEVRV